MPPKVNVKYVKFSAEEMAYDVPCDLSDTNRYPVVARGPMDWKKFINFRNGYIKVSPDIRKRFKTEAAIRQALQAVPNPKSAKTLPDRESPTQRRGSAGNRGLTKKRKIA